MKAQVRHTGQTIGCEYNAPEQLENGPAPGSADAVDVYSIAVIINQYYSPPFTPIIASTSYFPTFTLFADSLQERLHMLGCCPV